MVIHSLEKQAEGIMSERHETMHTLEAMRRVILRSLVVKSLAMERLDVGFSVL